MIKQMQFSLLARWNKYPFQNEFVINDSQVISVCFFLDLKRLESAYIFKKDFVDFLLT